MTTSQNDLPAYARTSLVDLGTVTTRMAFDLSAQVPLLMARALVGGASWSDVHMSTGGLLPAGDTTASLCTEIPQYLYAIMWRPLLVELVREQIDVLRAEGRDVDHGHLFYDLGFDL